MPSCLQRSTTDRLALRPQIHKDQAIALQAHMQLSSQESSIELRLLSHKFISIQLQIFKLLCHLFFLFDYLHNGISLIPNTRTQFNNRLALGTMGHHRLLAQQDILNNRLAPSTRHCWLLTLWACRQHRHNGAWLGSDTKGHFSQFAHSWHNRTSQQYASSWHNETPLTSIQRDISPSASITKKVVGH